MSLSARRRSLMGRTTDGNILYQIENYAFNGGYIDTGVKLCASDKDFTIAFDVTLETNPASGDGASFRLLRIINDSGSSYAIALYKQIGAAHFTLRYMSGVIQCGTISTDRIRFVITHEKNSGAAGIVFRNEANASVVSERLLGEFVPSTKNLVFGQTSGANQLPKGKLNRVAVYDRVLSASEIRSFMGVNN